MGEEPHLYVIDFSDVPGAADYREQRERVRAEARRRYHDYLTDALGAHQSADCSELADVALDTLTAWRYLDSGERCQCGCHPQLPESDLHDYGFACPCTQTRDERRAAFEQCRTGIDAFWSSGEGQRIRAAELAAEAELEAWLTAQRDVVVRSHGGYAPEQWWGDVAEHSFYFRERHGEWRIEVDLRPSGATARALLGTGADGEPLYEEHQLEEGEVVASGTTDVEGYGTTPLQRAMFIVDAIRMHLRRRECTLHTQDLSSVAALLGREIRWCSSCGARLAVD
jgi:hypothetical protein